MVQNPELKVTTPQETAGATDTLVIQVAPESGSSGGEVNPIQVELELLREAAPQALISAAEEAANQGNWGLLKDVVVIDGVGNWTVWARPFGQNRDVVRLWVRNNLDWELNLVSETERGVVAPDQPLTLKIPLRMAGDNRHLQIPFWYSQNYIRKNRPSFRSEYQGFLDLWLLAKDQSPPPEPAVELFTPDETPHAVALGAEVQLHWRVKNGISGKLTGPLVGGNAVLTLSATGEPNLSEGFITVRALSTQVYQLEVIVGLGEDLGDTRVIRRLILDVVTDNKIAALRTMPRWVLPHGEVRMHWLVWGVYNAKITTNENSFSLLRQPAGASRRVVFEEEGEKTIHAVQSGEKVTAILSGEYEAGDYSVEHSFHIVRWREVEPGLEDKQVGRDLAFAQNQTRGFLALRLGQRLLLREVGRDDSFYGTDGFAQQPHQTFAVTGAAAGFAVVRAGRDAPLLSVMFPGRGSGFSEYVPDQLRTFLEGGFRTQVHVLGGRCYVVCFHPTVPQQPALLKAATAWSYPLNLEPDTDRDYKIHGDWTHEPILAGMAGLVQAVCDDALFCLNRTSGQLFRLDPAERAGWGGTLSKPLQAAAGVDDRDQSLVKTGAPMVVSGLLVLVGSNKRFDMVYNPQTDSWNQCGRDLSHARAATFRDGDSPRAWALYGDTIKTLVVSNPALFDPDYLAGNPSLPLENPWFDTETFLEVVNDTGEMMIPPDADLIKAGYAGLRLPADVSGPKAIKLEPKGVGYFGFHHPAQQPPTGDMCWLLADSGILVQLRFDFTGGKASHDMDFYRVTRDKGKVNVDRMAWLALSGLSGTMYVPRVRGFFSLVLENKTHGLLTLSEANRGNRSIRPNQSIGVILAAVTGGADRKLGVSFSQNGGPQGSFSLKVDYTREVVELVEEEAANPMIGPSAPAALIGPGEADRFDIARGTLLADRPNQWISFGLTPALDIEVSAARSNPMQSQEIRTDVYLGWRGHHTSEVRVEVEGDKVIRAETHSAANINIPHKFTESKAMCRNNWSRFIALTQAGTYQHFTLRLTPAYVFGDQTYVGPTRSVESVNYGLKVDGEYRDNDPTIYFQPLKVAADRTPRLEVQSEVKRSLYALNGMDVFLGWKAHHCKYVMVVVKASAVTAATQHGKTLPLDGVYDMSEWNHMFSETQLAFDSAKPFFSFAGSRSGAPRFTIRLIPMMVSGDKAAVGEAVEITR